MNNVRDIAEKYIVGLNMQIDNLVEERSLCEEILDQENDFSLPPLGPNGISINEADKR
jgi:hypothetical protein|tara:strand:- start:330 stop:503 length:174 start_codon:yes stop_codon:yes gene_type:complete